MRGALIMKVNYSKHMPLGGGIEGLLPAWSPKKTRAIFLYRSMDTTTVSRWTWDSFEGWPSTGTSFGVGRESGARVRRVAAAAA